MTTGKRRTMIARATVAVAVVCLSAASAPRGASAFVQVAPTSSGITQPIAITHGPTISTALRYMSLEQVSDFYQNFPLQSAVLTCGVKASVADTIAQVKPQIEEHNSKSSPTSSQDELPTLPQMESSNNIEPMTKKTNRIDWEARRNLAYVLYGGIFVGVMSHVEYSCVFPFLFGNEKTTAITIEKVFFDNLIAAPIMWLPPAYFIKAWVYGSDSDKNNSSSKKGILAEGLEKYLVDVKENNLLWKYWAIWFPAQSVSFSVVPDHLRVAFMASISFFWFILFSTVSSQGDSEATAAASSAANASD